MMTRMAPDGRSPAAGTGSLEAALRWGQDRLRGAGVEAPRRDARLLLAAALELGPSAPMMAGERRLAPGQRRRFEALVERRRRREPVSRILGRREFWSLDLAISPATLDPRPDSETLVVAVLGRIGDPDRPRRVLDLGTGSGNLLLAVLAALPGAWGVGLDRDGAALATAAANAGTLGLAARSAFAAGDWGAALAATWDVILCNPPYVRSGDIDGLAPEVARYEPRGALDGGPDGLSAYRRVVPEIARLLARDGVAAVELGAGQAAEVAALARDEGLEVLECVRDLAEIQRCLLLGSAVRAADRVAGVKKSSWNVRPL
jgi:release factor glutamine methyltransferase